MNESFEVKSIPNDIIVHYVAVLLLNQNRMSIRSIVKSVPTSSADILRENDWNTLYNMVHVFVITVGFFLQINSM